MILFIAVAEVLTLQLGAWRLTRLARPEREAAILEAAATSAGLSLQSAYDSGAARRILGREHVAVLGQTALWLIAWPLLAVSHQGAHVSSFPPVIVVPLVIGIAGRPLTLSALLCWEVTLRRRGRGPRVARLSTPAIADYARPFTLWTTRVLAGLVVPGVVLMVWKGQSYHANKSTLSGARAITFTAVSLATLVLVEVVSRCLVTLSQPAASPLELQWDDAIRAMQIDELNTGATMLGVLLVTISLAVLYDGGVARFTIPAAVVLLALTGQARPRYLQRLWAA